MNFNFDREREREMERQGIKKDKKRERVFRRPDCRTIKPDLKLLAMFCSSRLGFKATLH